MLGLEIVAGEERQLASVFMDWVGGEVADEERVERLDDPCTRQQRGDVLAAGDVTEIRGLSRPEELVGRVDHDPAVPVGGAGRGERRRDLAPHHRLQDDILLRRLDEGARLGVRSQLVEQALQGGRPPAVWEQHSVRITDRVARDRLSDLFGTDRADRADPHHWPLSVC